jgi:hypothetical protein
MGGADMTTRLALIRDRNPLAALERLPGWWKGKAAVRKEEAEIANAAGFEKHADEQLRIVREYEKAEELTRRNGA